MRPARCCAAVAGWGAAVAGRGAVAGWGAAIAGRGWAAVGRMGAAVARRGGTAVNGLGGAVAGRWRTTAVAGRRREAWRRPLAVCWGDGDLSAALADVLQECVPCGVPEMEGRRGSQLWSMPCQCDEGGWIWNLWPEILSGGESASHLANQLMVGIT